MSRKKVIVKRLNAIQNFGAMDVLCTDKTGTLTMDRVILERHCDVVQDEKRCGAPGRLPHQPLPDRSEERARPGHAGRTRNSTPAACVENIAKVDEIPFDFSRRMMSVVVGRLKASIRSLTKGAPEAIFAAARNSSSTAKSSRWSRSDRRDLKEEYDEPEQRRFPRARGGIQRCSGERARSIPRRDEHDLILKGYVAFLDPPKESAARAIAALHKHGVSVKVLTGDNELVSRKVCRTSACRRTDAAGQRRRKDDRAELARSR